MGFCFKNTTIAFAMVESILLPNFYVCRLIVLFSIKFTVNSNNIIEMKKILLVFSLIILLSSCSSDSSASDNADTVLLTKRITTWANSSVTFETNYIYEGNKMKRMTIDAQNYTLFNYTGNLSLFHNILKIKKPALLLSFFQR